MVCSRCEAWVYDLAIGGMPVSVGHLWSRCFLCELTSWLSFSCYKPACHLFPTLAEYFMYSHLPYFLYIVAMLCYSEDEEYVDEDFF
jgi:hypothetical protein